MMNEDKTPVMIEMVERTYYYTREEDGVYLHESVMGRPFTKTLTPFPSIPFVKIPEGFWNKPWY